MTSPDRPTDSSGLLRPASLLIAARPDRPELAAEAERLAQMLTSAGVASVESLADSPDLVVALGGDGTVLHWVSVAAPAGVPVLGVNFGHVGFFCAASTLEGALKLVTGGVAVVSRNRVKISPEPGNSDRVVAGLNEVYFVSKAPGRAVRLAVSVDSEPLAAFTGDGLVVASPSGSTAYSMSAGGPIVAPALDALVLTQLAPHNGFRTPVVLPSSAELAVSSCDGREVLVLCDGVEVASLTPEAPSVTVSAATTPALLAFEPPAGSLRAWTGHLRSVMGLSGSPETDLASLGRRPSP